MSRASNLWPQVFTARLMGLMLLQLANGLSLREMVMLSKTSNVLAILGCGFLLDAMLSLYGLRYRFSRRQRHRPVWQTNLQISFPCALMLLSSCSYSWALVSLSMLVYDPLLPIIAIFFCFTDWIIAFMVMDTLRRFKQLVLATAVLSCLHALAIVDLEMIILTGAAGGAVLMLRIYHTRHRVPQALSERRQNYRAEGLVQLFEKSGNGWFWETDHAGNIVYISETALQGIAAKYEQVVGKPLLSLCAPGEMSEPGGDNMLACHLSSRTGFNDVEVQIRADGEEHLWSLSGTPYHNEKGEFSGFRGHGRDLTELQRSDQAMLQMARYDNLTGLANRHYLMEQFTAILETDQQDLPGGCTLMMLDLDRFKQVNDTLGHPIGDALLKIVADRLRSVVGDQGIIGRPGGDEFQILLPGWVAHAPVSELAKQIIFRLGKAYTIDNHQIVIGVSIGIALVRKDETAKADVLIRNADLALYAAKDAGKGQYCFYHPSMQEQSIKRRQIEQQLRIALDENLLDLVYQPIINVATEKLTGFEALCRWNYDGREMVDPAEFISVAEETGQMARLGEWVLRKACAEAVKWPGSTHIAVNITPSQFLAPGFAELVLDILQQSGLPPERLELEISESLFLDLDQNIADIFDQLKDTGVRLTLDDFGTGYSALGYLRNLRFDKIKIDQSFIRDAAACSNINAAIIRSVVQLADTLDIDTIAEGTETRAELELVRSLGFSQVQGYVYCKPMTADLAGKYAGRFRKAFSIDQQKADKRAPRHNLFRSVGLLHNNYFYRARVRNISEDGIMIEGLAGFEPGSIVELTLAQNLIVKATICWTQDEKMGLNFEKPINVSAYKSLKPHVITTGPVFKHNTG